MANEGKKSNLTCYKCESENLQIYDEKDKNGRKEVLADCPNPHCPFERSWWQRSDLEKMQTGHL